MYEIIQNPVNADKYNIKCPHLLVPQSLTIHNTGNTASAFNESEYMKNNYDYTGFHVVIDDKQVIECIPFDRNSWHAGDGEYGKGNRSSIGIEIAYSMDYESGKYDWAEENAIIYVSELLKKYGWGTDKIKQHWDWNGKNCPHRIRASNGWSLFKQRVQELLDQSGDTENIDLKHYIGRTFGTELIIDAYPEIGGESWFEFNSAPHSLSIYPDIPSALENMNADSEFYIQNGDRILYWGVIITDFYNYLIYKRDNGMNGIVSIKNKKEKLQYGIVV